MNLKRDQLKDMPLQEQIQHLNDVIRYLVTQVQDMRDMNRESDTPIMHTLQNLHLRTCALESCHNGYNLPDILRRITAEAEAGDPP